MVYYVRFVKVPEVSRSKNGGFLETSCSIDLRNDLGEDRFPDRVKLRASLLSRVDWTPLAVAEIEWQGTEWSLDIKLSTPYRLNGQVRLRVQPAELPDLGVDSCKDLWPYYSIYSIPFKLSEGTKAAPLAQRPVDVGRIGFGGELQACWEETGHSIAAHLWDAGVVLAAHMDHIANDSDVESTPLSRLLRDRNPTKPVEALELGSGCGVVSLELARHVETHCFVTMSDLDSDQELLECAIESTKSSVTPLGHLRPPLTLHWDKSEHRKLAAGEGNPNKWNLILVADCTYNVDSIPDLVETINTATTTAPEALVVVALKRRHDSEGIFFDKMQNAGLEIVHQRFLRMPDKTRIARGLEEEVIEIYQFARQAKEMPNR